jgi:hypothetical protein
VRVAILFMMRTRRSVASVQSATSSRFAANRVP